MGRPYSLDLRERVVATATATSRRQAAARFGVGIATAIRWMAAVATTGTVAAHPQGRPRTSKLDAHEAYLRALIAEKHDCRPGGAAHSVAGRARPRGRWAHCGPSSTRATSGIKKKTAYAAEQDRPDVKAAREAWFEAQPDLEPAQRVFLDETWTSTNMARTRGRCLRGERLRSPVPRSHWKTTTFLAALRPIGIAAPFVLDGPINRNAFETCVARALVTRVGRRRHRRDGQPRQPSGTGRACGDRGGGGRDCCSGRRTCPTSTRSKWFFSRLKAGLRKTAERTVEGLWVTIGHLVDTVTPDEAAKAVDAARYNPN